ncbi:MAG TPA: hypothetical protein PLT82_01580 [Candidatus Hydrogenedens sp.]|nr:hypothetical protein [Candidatus Hydrogenedens sp.]HOK08530.1 hypothetical protein [Candidatus Hydrogenedens sp.]HOL19018.1 hypothetical protein [Candidatus Hydrogenedens sp.]HPP57800.1 hypothetical protein [Candidatus Hydrogenedens sp.]
MNRKNFFIISSFILLLCIFLPMMNGCKKPEPPPPPPQEPPPPSPEQIYSEMRSSIQQFFDAVSNNTGIPKAQQDTITNNLRGVKAKYSAIENGKIAISRIVPEIEDSIRKARDNGRWGLVVLGINIFDVLRPGATAPDGKYARLLERAQLMLSRPKVEVNGFLQADNDLYVFLSVTDTATNKTETFKVREGEEFYELIDPNTKEKKPAVLKIVRVIGDQQSVEILYIPANDTWIVPGPKTKG